MLTILLVNDEEMLIGLCKCVLARIPNARILTALSGREAMEIAASREGAIDILLSDINMRGELDGVQLAERMEALQPAVKVLLMSALSPDRFAVRPTWRFLPKPFHPAELIAIVEETARMQSCLAPR